MLAGGHGALPASGNCENVLGLNATALRRWDQLSIPDGD